MAAADDKDFLSAIDRFLDDLDETDGVSTAEDTETIVADDRFGGLGWSSTAPPVTYGPLVSLPEYNLPTLPSPPSSDRPVTRPDDQWGRADGSDNDPETDPRVTSLDPNELPDLTPAGYHRDGRGSWRRDDASKVPGARDLTLRRLYGDAHAGVMRLPAGLVRHRRELAWAEVWIVAGDPVVEIPATAWDVMADCCLGVDAPELNVTVMVDTDELAMIAGGLSPATLRSHLARSTAPDSMRRRGSLWPPLVAGWWAARRAAPGRPASRTTSRRAS